MLKTAMQLNSNINFIWEVDDIHWGNQMKDHYVLYMLVNLNKACGQDLQTLKALTSFKSVVFLSAGKKCEP